MRRSTIGILAVTAATLAGCGSGSTFANLPRPPTPIDLTVYISNQRVLVSPDSVGAGPVVLIVTNQSAKTQSLTVQRGGGSALASTGPITPQATAQVTVDFNTPNQDYTVTTNPASGGGTDASRALPITIKGASLHIGRSRRSGNDTLLQP